MSETLTTAERVADLQAECDRLIEENKKLRALVADFEAHHHADGPDFHAGTELGRLLAMATRMRRTWERRQTSQL